MAGRANHCATMNIKKTTGFTLIELVTLSAVLGLLGAVLVPALARTSPNNKPIQCLNNQRQLCGAWQMYSSDSRDSIVFASDDGTGTSNPLNQYAWVQNHMDFNPGNRGNWDLAYLKSSPLWPYCGQNAAIWKCPSDLSYVTVNGEKRPRIRSLDMNVYFGGFAGTDGGWPSMKPYRVFLKTSELTPSPARLFVLLDMRPDAISWGNFMTDMTGYSPPAPSQYQLADFPGNLHNGACGFAFADAHTELKRWRDPRTTPPLPAISPLPTTPLASPNNSDVAWLQDRATRPR